MRQGWTVGSIGCKDVTGMIAHISFIATAIDVTCRTAHDIGIGTCHEFMTCEVVDAEEVVNTSGTSASIDVFLHLAAKYSDIGSTIYITTTRNAGTAKSAAIGIALNNGTFLYEDVGIMFLLSV